MDLLNKLSFLLLFFLFQIILFVPKISAEILIFDCKQLRETQTPKDYIKYEIDTDTQTFRQIFKFSNRDEPLIEKNVADGGLINSTFYPPYGFIYEYTDFKKYNYRFDYGPGDEFIDHEWLGSVKSTPSMKCTREK